MVDAATPPAFLSFKPQAGDKEVSKFDRPDRGSLPPQPAVSNETPEMVDRIGKPLAAFRVESRAGVEVSNKALKGKPALIGIGLAGEGAADLPYQFQRIIDEHKGGIRVVLLLGGAEGLTRKEAEEAPPATFTGDVVEVSQEWVDRTFGKWTSASAILVDADGVVRDIVRFHSMGERSLALENAARKLIAGEVNFSDEELAVRRARAAAWHDYWQKIMPVDRELVLQEAVSVPVAHRTKPPDRAVMQESAPIGWAPRSERMWFDVDGDGEAELIVPGEGGRVHIVRRDGLKREPILLDVRAKSPSISALRPVRTWAGIGWLVQYCDFSGERSPDRMPEDTVELFDVEGRSLWRYQPPVSVTPLEADEHDQCEFSLASGDLTGDGVDEILVGVNITRYRKTEGELNSWTARNAGRIAALIVLDSRGRTLSMSELGVNKIRWIEPLPGMAAVYVSLEKGMRRVEFKGLQSP